MKKLTLDYIKDEINKYEYTLLSDNYENSKTKLSIMCPKGHIYEASWSDFQSGYRCPYCYGNKKLTYEFVKEYIESFGYKLLSTEYKNTKSKLSMTCPLGHTIEMRFDSFKSRKRCRICANNTKFTYKFIKEYIESFNYKLLSNEYENSNSPLVVECCNGHTYTTIFSRFRRGHRCPYCSGNARLTYEYVKEYIESFGYKLLSKEYINNITPLKTMCPHNHIYNVTFHDFKSERRCPICNQSKGETSIKYILEKYNIDYDWQVEYDGLVGLGGGNLSYDFYLPKYNLLIEYQGEYHDGTVPNQTQEQFEKQQEHDRRKKQYTIDNNINLLEIWYWDFDNIEKILCKELKL